MPGGSASPWTKIPESSPPKTIVSDPEDGVPPSSDEASPVKPAEWCAAQAPSGSEHEKPTTIHFTTAFIRFTSASPQPSRLCDRGASQLRIKQELFQAASPDTGREECSACARRCTSQRAGRAKREG